MVRYAEWKKGVPHKSSANLVVAATVFVVTIGPAALFLGFKIPMTAVILVLATVAPMSYLIDGLILRRETAPLRDVPPALDQFPASITLLRATEIYGSDLGLVSFADGWLHFEGKRCSFSLPSGSPIEKVISQRSTTCFFEGPAATHSVVFNAESGFGKLQDRICEWSQGSSSGHAAPLPPVTSDGSVSVTMKIRLALFLAFILCAVPTFLQLHWVSLIFLLPLSGLAVHRVWDALDERKRLNLSLPPRKAPKRRSLPS